MGAIQGNHLLNELSAQGLHLSLSEDERIQVSPANLLTDELRALITSNRSQLLTQLHEAETATANATKAFMWRLIYPDGQVQSVTVAPPEPRAQILKYWPLARDAVVAQGCTRCIHYSQPFRYCGSLDRNDLPRAYGKGNCLRLLPVDDGASCEAFQTLRDDSS